MPRKEVAVYPSYLQLRKYELLAISNKLTLAGVKKIRRIAQQSEFERIKEYVPGDDRRTVNWKATARRGRMMVNQFQDERAQQVFAVDRYRPRDEDAVRGLEPVGLFDQRRAGHQQHRDAQGGPRRPDHLQRQGA